MGTISSKVKRHQQILLHMLEEWASDLRSANGTTLEYLVVADEVRNQFQLVKAGWLERKYIFSVMFHFSISPDAKIWIRLNDTELQIGNELTSRGILANDIVVAFHPEYLREHSSYAVK